MTYQQTLDYLYAQLPMFSRIGAAAYKKDLHNTIELCNFLDNPQHGFPSIHIAGTNGKGSASHMLAAILQASGYKTGLYTSPHLKDFGERIKINNEMIREDFVVEFVERTRSISEQVQPSFFELTVAMAFEYFAREKVDIAVIETGLGGRLDSTNVIAPLLSVITNIGYDHMNLLGNTLPEIAFEKAGIIKPNTPVVVGEYLPETKIVFIEKALKEKAPLQFVQEIYQAENIHCTLAAMELDVTKKGTDQSNHYSLDLNGIYQAKNLCTVLCATEKLRSLGWNIPGEKEQYALSNTKKLTGLHGRWDLIASNPAIVLDVAHNYDGLVQVLRQLEALQIPTQQVHFILGMVSDKDISKALSILPGDSRYYFTNAHIPRALPQEELRRQALAFGLSGTGYDDVNEAIRFAKEKAGPNDLLLVCGSVFVVAEVKIP